MWEKIGSILDAARERTLGALLNGLAEAKTRRDQSTFSIALIALSAKLAKADGVVTDDEVAAFKDFFNFPQGERRKVEMVYSLAQQDVAGFDHYLKQVAKLYEEEPAVLEDVLDCLFHIAAADGVAHPQELAMLEEAAAVFGIAPGCFARIKAAHLGLEAEDPLFILGLPPEADQAAIRARYRDLARLHHPDALVARGVPEHLSKIAEGRMAAVNEAYQRALERVSA
ncbi:MAG: molecular chaperone DjiA [Pseudomonadota bacterium]